jgi:hypothetical protein
MQSSPSSSFSSPASMPFVSRHEDLDPEKGALDVVLPCDLTQKVYLPGSLSSSVSDVTYALHRTESDLSTAEDAGTTEKKDVVRPREEKFVAIPLKVEGTTDHLKNKPPQFESTWSRASYWIQFQLWFNSYR